MTRHYCVLKILFCASLLTQFQTVRSQQKIKSELRGGTSFVSEFEEVKALSLENHCFFNQWSSVGFTFNRVISQNEGSELQYSSRFGGTLSTGVTNRLDSNRDWTFTNISVVASLHPLSFFRGGKLTKHTLSLGFGFGHKTLNEKNYIAFNDIDVTGEENLIFSIQASQNRQWGMDFHASYSYELLKNLQLGFYNQINPVFIEGFNTGILISYSFRTIVP